MPLPHRTVLKKTRYELSKDVKQLENSVENLRRTIYADPDQHAINSWPPPPPERHRSSIESRLDGIEDGISLILDFLDVEVKDQPSKKLVKRKKKDKSNQ